MSLKYHVSPIIAYSLIWLYHTISILKIKLSILSCSLILYSFFAFLSGIDYSGEILFCLLLMTLPDLKISDKDFNFSWLVVAIIGGLEYLGFIAPEFLQISNSTYEYFRIHSFLGNPYMNGVFSFLVLVKNAKNKNWLWVLLTLFFIFLLGNRIIALVTIFYLFFILRKHLNFKKYLLIISIFLPLFYFVITKNENVSWLEFDKPIQRIFSFHNQIENQSATIFLTAEFIQNNFFSFINLNVLPKSHWIYKYSVSDVMISYVAYSYGILFLILYIILLYKQIFSKKQNRFFLILCFLLLSISDPGIFHPFLVFLIVKAT